jgi:GxxExxY protein
MDTDERVDLRTSPDSKLLLREETHQIIGGAFEVLNSLGHGFHEKAYENALVIEFGLKKIPFNQQERFPILYKGIQVTEYVPDLIVFDSIIVDTKVVSQITDLERGQMMNYLRITKKRVGLILNFKYPKLQWERIVL